MRPMPKRTREIVVVIAMTLLLLVVLAVANVNSPQARLDRLPTTKKSPSQRNTTLVWGRITASDPSVLPNLAIAIGRQGVGVSASGDYFLSTPEAGLLPVTIFDIRNNQQYQIAGEFEQSVTVTRGISLHRDFKIEKVSH